MTTRDPQTAAHATGSRGSGLALAVLVDRVGPYHARRLERLGQALGPGKLLVIEVASASDEYAWEPTQTTGITRRTLFPDRSYQSLSRAELRREMITALERAAPATVAVNGWGFVEARAALSFCRASGTPAILMSDSQSRDAPRRPLPEFVKRKIVEEGAAALVGGTRAADYVVSLGMPRERVFPGFDIVDNAHFAEGARAARNDPSARKRLGLPDAYWLCVARFIPKKNLLRLLSAYARWREQGGTWDLVLVGDGPQRGELERRVHELGLRGAVHFTGFQQYPTIPAFYAFAKALILPSTSDQWGLVVNEAMAAGLPVLVSEACGCAPDLVREGVNGFVFHPNDEAAITEAMTKLSKQADLETFANASRELISHWDVDTYVRGMLSALEVATKEQPRKRALPNPFLLF